MNYHFHGLSDLLDVPDGLEPHPDDLEIGHAPLLLTLRGPTKVV